MKRLITYSILSVLFVGTACAQQQQLRLQSPHLGYVYPAGGKPGTTFTVVIGGQHLSGTNDFGVVVDGDCVSETAQSYQRPMTPKEQQSYREEMDKFQKIRKAGEWLTDEQRARAQEIMQKMTKFGRRPANPAISEFMTVQFTVAANAVPGDHEIRIKTPGGLSNPLKFCVGQFLETTKPDWKTVPKGRGSMESEPPPPMEATVKLPAIINGQIAPAGVDRYHFSAQKGRHIIVAVDARRLIPYLADAVPGWFEPTLTILDSKGKELASAERYRFRPDPVIHFEVPQDGSYTVEIHDSLYRGREDFVYRMTIGELPFVTGIFPLGGKAGDKTSVTLTGWNLPVKNLTLDNSAVEPGVTSLPGNFFAPVLFAVDNLPECMKREPEKPTGEIAPPASLAPKKEPGTSDETAQAVTLPIIINGRISRPGESDVFKFSGHAGQRIIAEVIARRLNSPLDSFLRLTDAAGKQLAFNDDFEDKGTGLETHHADSYLAATLPSDGTYFIHLRDTQGQGGPEFAYRLRLSEPLPDFALRVVPSSVNLRAGASIPITVYALRKDGFNKEIALLLKNGPPGATLDWGRVPEGQDKAQFTLTVPTNSTLGSYTISMEGSALIDGHKTRHMAVPADDMMQAFIYRHLVSVKAQMATIIDPGRFFPAFHIEQSPPIKLHGGGNASVRFSSFASPWILDRLTLELNEPPPGITIEKTTKDQDGVVLQLHVDSAKVKEGLKGNLIFDMYVDITPQTGQGKPLSQKMHIPVGSLPAVPFE